MMKGLVGVHQQPDQPVVVEENMSDLTSASNEASVSSVNRNDSTGGGGGAIYPQQYFVPPPNQVLTQQPQQAVKKKRNLPGNPDPESEVIALSPKTLMATNRFVCEICNKGFQRDQNLQLHRRGHNLPWKLKQRTNKEVIRKKVYVCPEASCVHHDPSRALGDLTGIKKHFCRKHGEKKWKCDKCSKRYAVQSDWKAHSKTCGTKEYRCDCGTLFSRRDSFITHRAFCDALAEESARAIPGNPLVSSQAAATAAGSSSAISHHSNNNIINPLQPQFSSHNIDHNNPHNLFSLKKEQHTFSLRTEIPPWLACSHMPAGSAGPGPGPGLPPIELMTSSIFPSTRFTENHQELLSSSPHENPSNPNLHGPNLPSFHPTTFPHISATALLQKAAQMGATMSSSSSKTVAPAMLSSSSRPHQGHHVSADSDFGLNLLSSHEEFVNGLASYGNKAAADSANAAATGDAAAGGGGPQHPSLLLQDMLMSSLSSSATIATFDQDAFDGIFNPRKNDQNFHQTLLSKAASNEGGDGGAGNKDGMTRDFLGLRPLSHTDIFNIAGLSNCMSTPNEEHHHQKSW
ncbi:hypothetical protein ACH5RR_024392 [Cinchona calisaya]|uniref:C2H2-type domain-containing protein n=1 Tax=Cinchona calisaya TaxID=153742 RepID=A0ABD2Z038_9GENT